MRLLTNVSPIRYAPDVRFGDRPDGAGEPTPPRSPRDRLSGIRARQLPRRLDPLGPSRPPLSVPPGGVRSGPSFPLQRQGCMMARRAGAMARTRKTERSDGGGPGGPGGFALSQPRGTML